MLSTIFWLKTCHEQRIIVCVVFVASDIQDTIRYHFQTPGDTLVVTLIMFLLLLIMYGSIRIYNSIKTLLCLYDFLKKKLNADAEAEIFFGPRLNQALNTGKSLNLSETDSWPKKGSSDSTNLSFHLKSN